MIAMYWCIMCLDISNIKKDTGFSVGPMKITLKGNHQPAGLIAPHFLGKSSARIENRRPMADGPTQISNPVSVISLKFSVITDIYSIWLYFEAARTLGHIDLLI